MRCNLLERLQPFSSDRWFEIREPRKVASGSAEVGDDTCTLRIGDSDKYRWNRLRGLPNRGQDRRTCGKNDLGSRGDERGSVSSEAFCIAGSKVIIYMNVAAFNPTKCRPRGFERFNALLRIKVGHEHADPANAAGLLRTRGRRPSSRRSSDYSEKIPPSHARPGPGERIVSAQVRTLIGPETCFVILFDYLVGASEQRRWHREAERLGGLEVDRQLVLGRVLHRQVSRFLALENTINVTRSAPVEAGDVHAIGD